MCHSIKHKISTNQNFMHILKMQALILIVGNFIDRLAKTTICAKVRNGYTLKLKQTKMYKDKTYHICLCTNCFRFLQDLNIHVIKFFMRRFLVQIRSRNLTVEWYRRFVGYLMSGQMLSSSSHGSTKISTFDVIPRSSEPFSNYALTLTVWAVYMVIEICTHNMNQCGTKNENKEERRGGISARLDREEKSNFLFQLLEKIRLG